MSSELLFDSEGAFTTAQGEYFQRELDKAGLGDFSISSIDGGEGGWRLRGPEELMPFAVGAVLEHKAGELPVERSEVEVLVEMLVEKGVLSPKEARLLKGVGDVRPHR